MEGELMEEDDMWSYHPVVNIDRWPVLTNVPYSRVETICSSSEEAIPLYSNAEINDVYSQKFSHTYQELGPHLGSLPLSLV